MGNTKDNPASHLEFTEIDAPLIRKIIAERMLESTLTIPHFDLFDEVDMKKSVVLRRELNADENHTFLRPPSGRWKGGCGISPNDKKYS